MLLINLIPAQTPFEQLLKIKNIVNKLKMFIRGSEKTVKVSVIFHVKVLEKTIKLTN